MKIRFSKQAWDDVTEIVKVSDKEVGMMGLVEFMPDSRTYYISHIFVPKQEVSSVTTDLDADSMAELEHRIFEGQQKGIYPIKANLNAWIHSHVNMNVMWSNTDNETIKEMAHYGKEREGLCVAVVVNKQGETRGAVCYNSGSNSSYVPSVFVDNVDVEYDYIPDLSCDWTEALKELVRSKSYGTGGGLYGRNLLHHDDDWSTGDWWENRKKQLGLFKNEESETNTDLGKQEAGAEEEKKNTRTSFLGLSSNDVPANEPEWTFDTKPSMNYTDYELCYFETLFELEDDMKEARKFGVALNSDEYDYWIARWRWLNGL